MLPDFPDIKDRYQKALIEHYLAEANKQSGILDQIIPTKIHEGNRWRTIQEDEITHDSEFTEISEQIAIKDEELAQIGEKEMSEKIQGVVSKLTNQISNKLFDKIAEAAKEAGNTTNMEGKPFTVEAYFNLLRNYPLEFDESGVPILPQFLVGSTALQEKIYRVLMEIRGNLELQVQFEAIIKQKKEEWHDRESHRKLVD